MATLKIVALRLKSVKNIQKITQSMKMVSAAKYTRAERDLRAAKPYGAGAQTFFEVNTSYFCPSMQKSLHFVQMPIKIVSITSLHNLNSNFVIIARRSRPGWRARGEA